MIASRTPDEALAELLAGNLRFTMGTRQHPHQDADHRTRIAVAQEPFAVIFGCSDSRLAAEIIFDRGLGDLFVVRTAGHITGPQVEASISLGVAVLDIPLVAVLAHDNCGAVEATFRVLAGTQHADPDLAPITDHIAAAVPLREDDLPGPDVLAALHLRHTISQLQTLPALKRAIDRSACNVIGMRYRLADGRVILET